MAITPEQALVQVRGELGHVAFDWKEELYLDTGVPELNEILGDPNLGIPYGRIIELSGWESVGKSALCFNLVALAQAEGALAIWIDFENSFNARWATMRGVDVNKLAVVRPYVTSDSGDDDKKDKKGKKVKKGKPRMTYCEELCSQAERLVEALSPSCDRIVMVMDSMAAMHPKVKVDTALEDQNMHTDQAVPKLLHRVFNRWVGLAQAHNVLILAINQLRENPAAKFQDPLYTPGGNAMRFFGHIRARMLRVKGGRLMQGGRQVGIQGILRNTKNKAGGLEKLELGYKLYFSGSVKFLPSNKLEKGGEEE